MADRLDNNFEVHVTGLGRIAEAQVRLRPLTLFVGENNSGKSYLATLIWSLYRMPYNVFEKASGWEAIKAEMLAILLRVHAEDENGVRHQQLLDWLEKGGPKPENVLPHEPISPSLARKITEVIEQGVRKNIQDAFRSSTVNPTILLNQLNTDFVVSGQIINAPVQVATRLSSAFTSASFYGPVDPVVALMLRWMSGVAPWDVNSPDITVPLGTTTFLPASRTGYMQTLPELIDRLLASSTSFNRSSPPPEFLPGVTAPIIQFLRFMMTPAHDDAPHADLARMVEERILHGRISRDPNSPGTYTYLPQNSPDPIPMGRSSAVVSELAPLLHYLRQRNPPKLLIYEEPEAHLHPRLQRIVAQVLVRLVNRGTQVLITTHSDTLAQQINNFIKMSTAQEAATKLGYTKEDFLSPDQVAAYGFSFAQDGTTKVSELPNGPSGITMPSFNDELFSLTQEALALDGVSS